MPGWWSTPHPKPALVIPTKVNLPFSRRYNPPPLSPKHASCFPSEYPAQNISSYNSTKMFFFLCHLMHSVAPIDQQNKTKQKLKTQENNRKMRNLTGYILIIGTEAVRRIAVPVWPEVKSVLPHPAMWPHRPVRSIFFVGKHIGKIWLVKLVGIANWSRAKSYRSGCAIRNLKFGWIIFRIT